MGWSKKVPGEKKVLGIPKVKVPKQKPSLEDEEQAPEAHHMDVGEDGKTIHEQITWQEYVDSVFDPQYETRMLASVSLQRDLGWKVTCKRKDWKS